MSILSKSTNNNDLGTPSFHEFKKQASFFLKEKIKSARLALTDVTPAQLLIEEATNGNPLAPDTPTLRSISRAAFEVDDYMRIVEILHKRFSKFERKKWRVSYNSLIVLEYLLTHGPESVSGELQADKDVIKEMESFQFIDEKGFNWGLAVRKKSERILKLLEKENLLKEERHRARKLTREIQGFGSFCQRSSSVLQHGTFGRSNSQFNQHNGCQENLVPNNETTKKGSEITSSEVNKKQVFDADEGFSNSWMLENPETSFKENLAPQNGDSHRWEGAEEDNPLLYVRRDEPTIMEEDHPFSLSEKETAASLLSARDGILQGC